MKFEDVFPYDKNKYLFIIDFFEKYTGYKDFAVSFSEWAQGISCPIIEIAGIDLPFGDDQRMRCGPRIWEGPSFCMNEQELDFHRFTVIMLIAAKVFLSKMRNKGITEYYRSFNLVTKSEEIYTEERFIKNIDVLRKNFYDILWIKGAFIW